MGKLKQRLKAKCICGKPAWAKGKCHACYAKWGRSLQHISRGEERVVYFDFSCGACAKSALPDLCEAIRRGALISVVLATFNDGSSHFIDLKEIKRENVEGENL